MEPVTRSQSNLTISTARTPRTPAVTKGAFFQSTPSELVEQGMSSVRSSRPEESNACKKCCSNFWTAITSCFTKNPTAVDIQEHVLANIWNHPDEVLEAMNRGVPLLPRQHKNINIKNKCRETIFYLLCMGELSGKVFTLKDGTQFKATHQMILALIKKHAEREEMGIVDKEVLDQLTPGLRVDLEVRDHRDHGFLSKVSLETRKAILCNTTPQRVRESTSITFLGAIEKAFAFNTVQWFDLSMERLKPTWIQDKTEVRNEFLNAAKNSVAEWPEKSDHVLEHPEPFYALDVVIRFSSLKEWSELLAAMLTTLDSRVDISPRSKNNIKQQMEDALRDERTPQQAVDLLGNCKFYKAQHPHRHFGSMLIARTASPRKVPDDEKK